MTGEYSKTGMVLVIVTSEPDFSRMTLDRTNFRNLLPEARTLVSDTIKKSVLLTERYADKRIKFVLDASIEPSL